MKKMKVIVAVLLIVTLLSGCGLLNEILAQSEKEYTQGDISVVLPANFINYSSTAVAGDFTFLFANDEIGVLGLEEKKEDLFDIYGQMDLQGYAKLLVQLHELDSEPVQKDGFWTFSYDNEAESKLYTYVSVFYETSSAFWNIQVYCLKDQYEKNAEKLWKYATSIQIADNGVSPVTTDVPEEVTEESTQESTEATTEDVAANDGLALTLNLPDDFLNYTGTTVAQDYALMYANNDIGIIGIQDNKEEVTAYFGETDLESYANLIAQLYEIDAVAEEKDGIWTYSYTSSAEGVDYTYVSAFHETETDYWNIQGYCLTEAYEQYADDIWQYITDVDFHE